MEYDLQYVKEAKDFVTMKMRLTDMEAELREIQKQWKSAFGTRQSMIPIEEILGE